MKRKIIRAANPNPKVLQEQSGKLKEKLQSLKQQIQQKKKEKEMSKHNQLKESRSSRRLLQPNSRSSLKLQGNQSESDMSQFLAKLQMDHLASKLKERNINTLEDLKAIKPQTLDEWKDIPVGYRLKLKKQLNASSISKLSHSLSPSEKKLSLEKQKHIEEIMQVRKKDKVYVPLPGQSEQEEPSEHAYELTENQQEEMIQSLMDAFNREGQLQEIQLQPNQKPVVVVQSKQAWRERQEFPNYRYCWSCLKMLQGQSAQTYQDRSFCGESCLQNYKQVIKVEQDNQLFIEIEETENKFSKYLQTRKQKAKNARPARMMQANKQEEVDLDFSIL